MPLVDFNSAKLYMVIIWKVKNNVIHNKTYQFWQHWLNLHSLYSTRDFQVRKINMVQFVNTVLFSSNCLWDSYRSQETQL